MPKTACSLTLAMAMMLGGCNLMPGNDASEGASSAAPAQTVAPQDQLGARDPAPGATPPTSVADDQPRPVMQMQVVLDRLGFTPGVVDGKEGLSTRNALLGFQEANGLDQTGTLDQPTTAALAKWNNIPATRVVTIPADFAAGPFEKLPAKAAEQAKLKMMGYESLDEKLAERFHTTVATLQTLNPVGAAGEGSGAVPAMTNPVVPPTEESALTGLFQAGQQIRVPNVGADQIDAAAASDAAWRDTLAMLGVGSVQPKADRIVVSKSKGTLRAYNAAGTLVAMFTATMGSSHDPLPVGNWKILGVAHNPPFHYNPALFWDVSDKAAKQLLPPGPNGPVGVVWIDLSKPHYGIHGTPSPETIGRAQSHGCVRLTNWDVARLAQMVSTSTKVEFQA